MSLWQPRNSAKLLGPGSDYIFEMEKGTFPYPSLPFLQSQGQCSLDLVCLGRLPFNPSRRNL